MTPEQVSSYGELGVHDFQGDRTASQSQGEGTAGQSQGESGGIGLRRSQRTRSIPGHFANYGALHVHLLNTF